MEGYSIYWVDQLHAVLLDTMALERIFCFLNFWTWIKVLHGYSAFD